MTNNDLFQFYYPYLDLICKQTCTDFNYIDDFKQEMFLIFIQLNNDLLNNLHNKKEVTKYFRRICLNQWRSSSSPFYTLYKKDNHKYISKNYIINEDQH